MFLTDFCTRKYTRGIILWVGIFLTVTPAGGPWQAVTVLIVQEFELS